MKKRIEEKTSRTAEMNCLIRAISYYDRDKRLKSGDWVAPLILPAFFQRLCKTRLLRAAYRHMGARGMYEYVVARTKYIDALFEKYAGETRQALIFGAGFDSRFIRFSDSFAHAVCFELDSPITQCAKREQFKQRGIDTPPNIVYIPIDFLKDSVRNKLEEYGFGKGERCIFVLEGLTMYLSGESMDATFSLLSDFAGEESVVVFDYVHSEIMEGGSGFADERKIRRQLKKLGEQWTFGFMKGGASLFLTKHGFITEDEADSGALEECSGLKPGSVSDTHVIVTARKASAAQE